VFLQIAVGGPFSSICQVGSELVPLLPKGAAVSSTIRLAFAKREKGAPKRTPQARATASACVAPAVEHHETPRPAAVGAYEGTRAVSSLARAFSGSGTIEDAGALAWIVLRQVVPSDAMAIFLPDGEIDGVRAQFAVGLHAEKLRALCQPAGTGVAGWVFAELEPLVNAEAAHDFESPAESPLRWSIAVPLIDADALAGVLVLYRGFGHAYSEADVRLLELLAPRLASAVLDSAPADYAPPVPKPAPSATVLRRVK
jgi:GAF domain-containing protein